MNLTIKDENIYLLSDVDLANDEKTKVILSDIIKNKYVESGKHTSGKYFLITPLRPLYAFMLRHSLKYFDVVVKPEYGELLKEFADKTPFPHAKLSEDKKRLEVTVPMVEHYRELMRKVDATPKPQGKYTVPVSRAIELYTAVELTNYKYPKIAFTKETLALFKAPIPGFDGSIESLRNTPLSVLNVIKVDTQSWQQRKASKKNLEEKFLEHGIENLQDLLFEIPRRYIDKSNPQKVGDLIVGESATIVGKVLRVETFNSGRGLNLDLELDGGGEVRVSFFAGSWMSNKFKEGSEVIATGKYKPWRQKKQISGDTIDFADSAASLPVTPIYAQSATKGVTTTVVMRAVQELFARLGDVELPFYLQNVGKDIDGVNSKEPTKTYADIIKAVHFPENMAQKERAIKELAFYELVEMQIIIQSRNAAKNAERKHGLVHRIHEDKAYETALKNLPFKLTGAQKTGIQKLSEGMSNDSSYQALLASDVGTGKTILAQLSCLIAHDSGYQSVVLAPTEILARQLHNSFLNVREMVEEPWKSNLNIVFYTGSMKAKEKREVLEQIRSGYANIIISTQAAATGKLEFNDLGFVAVDEQQKFGSEQRSALLSARSDGRVPDLMMMTATPIPRSTAQVFYGDMDFIKLDEKPAGRLPIITEWIEEHPSTMAANHFHSVWSDVKDELEKGNKAFVIAPLVEDSDSIDASSVESTYKALSKGALTGAKIAFVHGKMKAEETRQIMQDFRDGVYNVLVASTVVEVGVDIPEATRVVVLSADRLGASTLHQIRGRVGRNSLQSKCYLVAHEPTDNGRERLTALVNSDDGFEIAKSDLAIRGEGQLFGSAQSGKSEFKFLKIARHGRWVKRAAEEAEKVLNSEYGNQAVKICKEKVGFTGDRIL